MGTFRMLKVLGWKAHLEAFLEVFVTASISVSPILIGGLVRWFQVQNQELSSQSYMAAVNGFLVRGELFLYALAFIAVVAWIAFREWPLGLRPPRIALGLFCLFSYGLITAFYSLDTANVALHVDAVLFFSKCMFLAALFFYWLATLLSKIEPPDLAAVLAESSRTLAAKLGGGGAP